MKDLWYGGIIYTMNSPGDRVEAIFTKNGKIIDAGNLKEIRAKYSQEILTEHNLKGKVMFPGFVDSHLHIIGHGERLINFDLSEYKSPKSILNALKSQVNKLKPGEWLIGEGWDENKWDNTDLFSRKELDNISREHPIMLSRICRHAILVNSKAMELSGINENTENVPGGVIIRDHQEKPTGFLHDNAQNLVKNNLPEIEQSYLEKCIKFAVQDMLSLGLVGGHTEDLNYYGGFKKTYNAFKEVLNEKGLKFHAHLLAHHEIFEDLLSEGLVYKQNESFVQIGSVKIFIDGTIAGRTAWLSEEYEDDPGNFGTPIHKKNTLKGIVQKARDNSFPIAAHAIGDKAIEEILNIIIEMPPPSSFIRDRLIHGLFLREELYEKILESNVVVDIQPTFTVSDFPWIESRIGKKRSKYAHTWKSLINSGIVCAGGSDAPIEPINPLLSIQAAILRKSTHDSMIYNKNECLTRFEAISLYTNGSAFAIGEELSRGKISPSFGADFTIFDKDLFSVPVEKLTQVKVEMTIVDGTIMYQRSS